MGKDVPKANDEAFGVEAAERNTYWCNLAMVRADYQGKGIAKAMFELAYKEVRTMFLSFNETPLTHAPPFLGSEDWSDSGSHDDQYPQCKI